MKHAGITTKEDVISRVEKRGHVGVHRYRCDFCNAVTPMPDRDHLAWCVREGFNFSAPLDDAGNGGYWPEGWLQLSDGDDVAAMCPRCVAKLPPRAP